MTSARLGAKVTIRSPFCSPLANRVWRNEPLSSSGFIGCKFTINGALTGQRCSFRQRRCHHCWWRVVTYVWNDAPTRNGLMEFLFEKNSAQLLYAGKTLTMWTWKLGWIQNDPSLPSTSCYEAEFWFWIVILSFSGIPAAGTGACSTRNSSVTDTGWVVRV